MKLFLIGNGERGKTTLLRRLRETGAGETERTEGIDIGYWDCRGHTGLFRARREPIRFLAWDFAGQDIYQTTHQLFYSRRALYLAIFRLSDGFNGISELESWLRNVQVCTYIIECDWKLSLIASHSAQSTWLYCDCRWDSFGSSQWGWKG